MMQDRSEPSDGQTAARRRAMAVLAGATAAELRLGLARLPEPPQPSELRRPETGLVMLRGRIAGQGARFNVGEATVTRASVRLASGEVGASYILGRDAERARLAALVDALWQRADFRAAVEAQILAPSRGRQEAERAARAARTAATKVDFFTLVRGEDEK
ncbi:MAG: phosphonate C-P lyase system protein PhnG [Roseiarcus sp.]|jgi:alpha-D-ribose 1-methylphosphonate 5-triphosphate synthase subunit PhnG